MLDKIFSGGAAALDPVFRMMKGLTRWTYGVQKALMQSI